MNSNILPRKVCIFALYVSMKGLPEVSKWIRMKPDTKIQESPVMWCEAERWTYFFKFNYSVIVHCKTFPKYITLFCAYACMYISYVHLSGGWVAREPSTPWRRRVLGSVPGSLWERHSGAAVRCGGSLAVIDFSSASTEEKQAASTYRQHTPASWSCGVVMRCCQIRHPYQASCLYILARHPYQA